MVTTLELQRRGLPYAVVVDGAATTASLQALDRQGLPYLVEVADGATMASRRALEARGLRYLVPVLVDATPASKASLAAQGLRYAVQVDADILPADRLVLQRQGLACYVEVDSSGNSVSAAAGGGAALLVGETDGFATDFTHPVDVERVAVKAASATTSYALDSFYTNAGTSPKMVWDVNGVLGWSPHNMFLNSAAPATQSVTTVVGQNYTVTVVGSGSMTGSAGAAGVATAGSPLTYTATTTTSTFTKTGTVTQIQMNRGAVATAYLATTAAIRNGLAVDYHPVTHAALGLLCEPAATNLLVRSSEFDNASWIKNATTITANAIAAPTGVVEADTFTPSATTTVHDVNIVFSGTAAAYTFSCFVKPVNGQFVVLAMGIGSSYVSATFDLTAKTTTQLLAATWTGQTSAVQDVGNGWLRLSVTATITAATITTSISFSHVGTFTPDAFGRQGSGVGTGTAAYYLWGAEVELGTIATSVIPTYGATSTRAGENYKVTSASINHSATAGSWWAEVSLSTISLNARIIGYETSSFTPMYMSSGAGNLFTLYDGNSVIKAVTSVLGNHKVAAAFQSADRAITADGLAVATDATAGIALGSPGTSIGFGSLATGLGNITGYIRKLRYVPRRKTNPEMVSETT